MKMNMKDEILYYCFPQLYAQCKVINTLADLNMIRHTVPEAALADKRDICAKKEEISACFLDWSKCKTSFLDEVFAKLFRPYKNLFNNLNLDNYETDVDKTKGFLDFQKILLGVDINATRLTFMKTIEDDLKTFEDHKFRKDSIAFHVDLMVQNNLLSGLIDSEKLAFYKEESYVHTDLKAPVVVSERVQRERNLLRGSGGESQEVNTSGVQAIPNIQIENRVLVSVGPRVIMTLDVNQNMTLSSVERILGSNAPIVITRGTNSNINNSYFRNLEQSLETVDSFDDTFDSNRNLEETPAPLVVTPLQYLIDETALDLKVIATDSGVNVISLETSLTALPAMGEVLAISITDPSGSGSGDDGGSGSGDGGDGSSGTDTNGTGTASESVWKGTGMLLATIALLVVA